MTFKELGCTGIYVSEIAFGGVEIGLPYGMGAKERGDMPAEQEAISLLHRAIDEGINFFDTARLYGESERLMGLAFEGKRREVVLASKCRHLRGSDGKIPSGKNMDDFINDSLKESLAFLQTDYLDLFMVHYADEEMLDNNEMMASFQKLKEKGRVRAVGVSVYKPEETKKAVKAGVWDVIQLPFNLMDQSHGEFFDDAGEAGIGIVVRSVLMRGMLTDRLITLHPALSQVERRLNEFQRISSNNFDGLSSLATKFALAHNTVSSVLVGIDKMSYLEKAVQHTQGAPVSDVWLQTLKQMAYPDPGFLNLAEWDKNGWL